MKLFLELRLELIPYDLEWLGVLEHWEVFGIEDVVAQQTVEKFNDLVVPDEEASIKSSSKHLLLDIIAVKLNTVQI